MTAKTYRELKMHLRARGACPEAQAQADRFVAADLPDANELTVGVMALVAQHEREAIAKRTREALQVARGRGKRLGIPNGATALRLAGKGNQAAVRTVVDLADAHARNLEPVVSALNSEGIRSLSALADALNGRGMLTPRGGRWHKSSVRNLLMRLEHPYRDRVPNIQA